MNNDFWINYWRSGVLSVSQNNHSKVGRTIGGVPISDEQWRNSIEFIFKQLGELSGKRVVDICAGSGVLTVPLSKYCHSILAIDIAENLLDGIPKERNIVTQVQDVRKLELGQEKFDVAICYFAIQHFTEQEVIEIFTQVFNVLSEGGVFYIGDIPDVSRRFDFFNNTERRSAFFKSVKDNSPIIGTWFHPHFLQYLGDYTGFSDVQVLSQPDNLIFSHYRFDIIMRK